MIEAAHYSATGTRHKTALALPADYFDGTVNEPVLHQAIKTYLGNQRQGTAKTKTRSFVSGGNQKPWKQKGTGRARSGSSRSPLWRGGGTVFGPIPRDYRADIPRKVRQLARRSALNARAREESLFVVDAMTFDAPKTSKLAGMLEKMGLEGKKVLVLANGENRNLYLSGRNIPAAKVMNYSNASAYDVIWSDAVVVEQGALGAPDAAEGEAAEAAPKKAKPARKPAAKSKAAPKVAAKSKKPAAAKKPAAKKKKES
ncbi:MAG TPA: 50S ribosomal protein L4 [Gemmatimonadales bacterium]|nr:50S ribosomal protein L4 [Gemmatimonadales bacterium]